MPISLGLPPRAIEPFVSIETTNRVVVLAFAIKIASDVWDFLN